MDPGKDGGVTGRAEPARMPRVAPRTLLLGVLAAAVVLALSALLADAAGRSFAFVAKEPASALATEECAAAECGLTGMLATITSLVWFSGAAAALFAWALLRRHGDATSAFGRLVLAAGLLTLVMTVDDLFLLHDYVFDEWIPHAQSAASALYAVAAIALVYFATRTVALRAVALLVAASGLLGISAGLDRVWDSGPYVVEDGLKLFGVVAWTMFLVAIAVTAADEAVTGRRGT